MKSTRYDSSSGLFAHPGTDASRVSFAGAVGAAAAGFSLWAESDASARVGAPDAAAVEGGGADRAALSCGAEAPGPAFASLRGPAEGAVATLAPMAVLSDGERPFASSVTTAGGSHSGASAVAALSAASSSRSGGGEVAPRPPQWQPDGTIRRGRRRSASIPLPTRPLTWNRTTESIRRPPEFPGERRPGRFLR